MADQFALNDAAMASPRPRPAIPALALQLPTFAGTDLPVSRSPVGNDPRSRTPPKIGELALTQGQIAQVSRQLWPPEGTIGADAVSDLRAWETCAGMSAEITHIRGLVERRKGAQERQA